MGRSRRRQRLGQVNGNGDGYLRERAGPAARALAPAYVPMRDDRAPIIAPVLELEGLDPWTEIRGPALALEDDPDTPPCLTCDDPAQLELAPAPEPDAGIEAEAGVATGATAEVPSADEPVVADDPVAGDDAPAATAEAAPATALGVVESDTPAPDPIELLYAEARGAADAGETERAVGMYRLLLAERPSHVRARNNLALLLDAGGDHQAALAELDRALDLDPENGTLLVNRGALLGAMGRFAAAERDLKRVLRVEPSHAEALFNLGVVMAKKGLWCEAVPHLRRAAELQPGRAVVHYQLGEALNHVDDLGGALGSYQRAAELQPDNPRALYGLGIIYDRLARPDDAARMYRRSREVGRR